MRPVLKAPGSMLLKLRYDGPLSKCAFDFNFRQYTAASLGAVLDSTWAVACVLWGAAFTVPPAWEARRDSVAGAARWASAEVGGRWRALGRAVPVETS